MFLMANGYQPSDVEQLILGAPISSASVSEDDEVEVTDRDEGTSPCAVPMAQVVAVVRRRARRPESDPMWLGPHEISPGR